MSFSNKVFQSLLLIAVALIASAQDIDWNATQKIDWQKEFAKSDFSGLWLSDDNSMVLGFCGRNYERARIKFISVSRDTDSVNKYIVYGKTMVKDNVCGFDGSIVIRNIAKYKHMEYGLDDEYKSSEMKGQYRLEGDYELYEDSTSRHAGKLYGHFVTRFYVDKNGIVKYMDIDNYSDGFSNNQFEGKWRCYQSKEAKTFNWGDFRVPQCGDLDVGSGEFSPNEAYIKNGWKLYFDAYIKNDSGAMKIERMKWW